MDLSQQERDEQARSWLSEIVESSDDAIVGKSLDGVICTWNRGAERLYGYTAGEAIGKSILLLIPPELHQESLDMLQCIRHGEEVNHHETVRMCKDGHRVLISSSLSPMKNVHGEIAGISSIARDITQKKSMEEEAREQARVLDLAQVLIRDMDNRIVLWSGGAQQLYGFTQNEAVGRICYELLQSEFPEPLPQIEKKLLDVGIWQGEVRRQKRDGAKVWVESIWALHRDAHGRPTRILETDTDITQRKLTAQLLCDSEQKVRKTLENIMAPEGELGNLELADLLDVPTVQSLVDDVFKLAKIPMFILDLKGTPLISAGWQDICMKFHRASPESCKNCSESDRELSWGIAPGVFKLYKCKNNMWDAVTPIMVGKQHVGNVFSGQFFLDDEPFDYPLFRSQAKKYGFDEQQYLAALDRVPRLSREAVETGMTFYMKLAQLLSQLGYSGIKLARSLSETERVNTQLTASVKELEAFTYSVSHDLRAPLRHLDGFLTLLSKRAYSTLDATAKHYVDNTHEASRRMGTLIDDLLQFSRLGRSDLHTIPVNANTLIEEVIRELEPETHDRAIHWQVEKLPMVTADPGMLRQVIENLLANALKFTRQCSEAEITIGSTVGPNGEFVFFVRDNGAGFDMQYYNKLFQVFQRLHSEDEFEGTGIGLANVRRMVERHGGRVWAEGSVGTGATFYFSLPSDGNMTGEDK
jgi:PAS domain S-box-containing protein